MFCRVYVDGDLLANHTTGGFSSFWVHVPASQHSSRELVVVSSNVFSKDLTPTHLQNYDFYQYGGLFREVSWHTLPADAPHIASVEVVPKADDGGRPNGLVDVAIRLASGDGSTVPAGSRVILRKSWDSAQGAVSHEVVEQNGLIRTFNAKVPSPMIWDPSPERPRPLPLHTLRVELLQSVSDPAVDGLEVRFGIRTVGKKGRDILINGEPVKLKGVNRHDMYPNQGPVLMPDQLHDDIDLIRTKLNGNFVRGSHYQQDDRFLDLCDESGLLLWSEVLGWGNDADTMQDERFMRAQLESVEAMLDANLNHPSIILWGFFNEGKSTDAATTPSYEAMASAFRARDSSRLITWADNRHEGSLNLQFADVISFNDYPGWYGGDYTTIASTWQKHAAWAAANFPDCPFIISEAGAGGIVGNHSSTQPPGHWSLEYESLVDHITAQTAMTSPNISGIALWQYADIKVDQTNTSTGRPGGINNKGLVDQWRRVKPAADAVAAAFGSDIPELGLQI